jgi:hypothetical protein
MPAIAFGEAERNGGASDPRGSLTQLLDPSSWRSSGPVIQQSIRKAATLGVQKAVAKWV